MEVKQRKEWIDFLRGIAMLLVIWGHIAKTEYPFFLLTSPFKLPLFFALTGYLFNDRDGNVKEFGKVLLLRIIIPWLLLSLVWLKIGYSVITGNPQNILHHLYSVISGESFWFMPCCILAECIQFFIRKFIKREPIRCLIMVAVSIAGLLMTHFGVGSFALFDVACTAQVFMMFGFLFKSHESFLREKTKPSHIWILLTVYIGLIVLSYFVYPKQIIDVHHNDYYNYAICIPLICISLFLLFIFAPQIKIFPKWIVYVGQNTLVFYMLHYAARTALTKVLGILRVSLPDGEIGYIIMMVYACVTMTVAAWLLNKFLPFAVGKRKMIRKT